VTHPEAGAVSPLATLVSTSAGDAEQGAAFGVTQGASSLGLPLMAVLYIVAVGSSFLAGALLLVPVAVAFGRSAEFERSAE